MKKAVLAITALLTFSAAQAAITNTPVVEKETVSVEAADERVPVKLEELPEAVTKALATMEGWKPSEAFLIKGEQTYYEVTVKNEAGETSVVKLTEDGQQIK